MQATVLTTMRHDGIDTGERPQTAPMKMVMVMAMVMEDKMEKMT
jgi:hypothetical protein